MSGVYIARSHPTKRMADWYTIWHFPDDAPGCVWDMKYAYRLSIGQWDQVKAIDTHNGRRYDIMRAIGPQTFEINDKQFEIWLGHHFTELI